MTSGGMGCGVITTVFSSISLVCQEMVLVQCPLQVWERVLPMQLEQGSKQKHNFGHWRDRGALWHSGSLFNTSPVQDSDVEKQICRLVGKPQRHHLCSTCTFANSFSSKENQPGWMLSSATLHSSEKQGAFSTRCCFQTLFRKALLFSPHQPQHLRKRCKTIEAL